MARPTAGRHNADEPASRLDKATGIDAEQLDGSSAIDPDAIDSDDGPDGIDPDDDGTSTRSAATDRFWAEAKMDPLEIALPGGVGYTLRAYRMDSQITPTDASGRQDDIELPKRRAAYVDEPDDELLDASDADEALEFDPDDEIDADEIDADDVGDDAKADEPAERADEEVPLFLGHAGHLLLFRTVESLVAFVRSDAEHDLTQLDGWASFATALRPTHVVPQDEDSYELDLVVKNLRGGHDAWDPQLIVQSGQLARDLGHALRIEPVVTALATGSPLDDLDDALRGVAAGGIGTFFARRKTKKIGTETASLAWRSVIGKISAVVDWRD